MSFGRFLVACVLVVSLSWIDGASAAEARRATNPGLKSEAALVVDAGSGEVIYAQKPTLVTPIASLTKLMTALVVLDARQPLDQVITITKEDHWRGKGAFSRLAVGTKLTRADLLKLALMASENRAAHVLARNYPGGTPAFVKAMNAKAKALGMTRTRFADASGLSSGNVSCARDLATLLHAASRHATIQEFSTLRSHDVRLGKRLFTYRNTNLLVGRPDWDILVQKTGYTSDAGECLAMQAMIDERPVTMIFLNSFGKLTRTAEARRIRKWMATRHSPALVGSSERAAK